MAHDKPSFAARAAAMRDAAEQLERIAANVAPEAREMAAAEKRFSQRRTQKADR